MKILHLYHDIMNLYGDYANVSAIKRILERSGEDVSVTLLSLGDNADFSEYDFIYMGSGIERNQRVVLGDFARYKNALSTYIKSGKPALFTGNSFEMLGKTITDADKNSFEGLGLCSFTVEEQNKTRLTSDVIYDCDFLDKPLVGFVNKCGEINGAEACPFTAVFGLGNSEKDKREGVRLGNLFGTHLTGPVLIKNPHFLEYIAEIILGKKPNGEHLIYERKGYEVTLNELKKRMES